MKTRLIIDGNAVYEIDEECEACRYGKIPWQEKKKQTGKAEAEEQEADDHGKAR